MSNIYYTFFSDNKLQDPTTQIHKNKQKTYTRIVFTNFNSITAHRLNMYK